MREETNACKILVGKSEENRPLEKPRYKWLNNIEMDFVDRGFSGIDWTDFIQDKDQ
jgi:hypothetical protein